jgi:DNA-binding transcriptional ArsR family regulator
MEKREKIMDLFLHDKPTGVLLSLKDSTGKYASVLSKETDCTYTHTLKILTQLQGLGIVEFEKKGRIKFVKLTPVGFDIAHELEGLVRQLERLSEEKPEKEKPEKKSKKKKKKK